ncbi:uncharacterized protein PHACADRAFT_259513 [Phanerochaete carnosa HHB-10118-sp]|uniref:F-box domain-containing protein n=1 Tax=Phanerochaete carnosa (strain HHB-10118-sp) TaxID=650164 RepID=K5VP90_PHACS|nr:uncharacterized protein PHACADRAFT_259513 [Phanerochaete carnosa HHB-10118-sp]EKM53278.1 hypothetical protein PHACADRAFT_259513 [Phanerochaete carnosa HHB-10118-sp]
MPSARHQPPEMSASQWPERHAKRPSPQLPTPPEECSPVPEPKRETSRKAKRISPKTVEDMEVLAGKSRPRTPVEDQTTTRPHSEAPEDLAPYPLVAHLSDPVLLENLLTYLSYYEWLRLATVSKEIRHTLYEDGREQVLARYLQTVGYSKWTWNDPEPLILTVEDLNHYMRGVSIPTHSYAAIANNWLRSKSSVEARTMQDLTFACRAFTRVVLRLRAQAEAEAAHIARIAASMPPSPVSMGGARTRTLSQTSQRLPAKWASQSSLNSRPGSRAPSPSPQTRGKGPSASQLIKTFHSPLFRLRRAPLLQVFVPSPEGDWLSDASVLECEAELKRSGVLHLLRAGDVIWDIAAGDEANAGRLIWDGSYLIDLDYTYSKVGDPPKYLPTLAFPPSYFHRVIRTMGTGNPIVRIDLSPWADDIKENLQLVQDKMRMDTPQGGRHTVVRWLHRSSFLIRPPPGSRSIRLPLPHPSGPGPSPAGAWIVDPDWFGTVVASTIGSWGPVVPSRRDWQLSPDQVLLNERRTVFRILREKSRPGEIWIRVVTDKERIIPL